MALYSQDFTLLAQAPDPPTTASTNADPSSVELDEILADSVVRAQALMDTSVALHSIGQPFQDQYNIMQEIVLRARLLSAAHPDEAGSAIKLAQLEQWYQQLQAAHTAATGAGSPTAATTTSAAVDTPAHTVVLPPRQPASRATATHIRSSPNELGAAQEVDMGYSSDLEADMEDPS